MAADPARRQATYEDVLNAPEHVVAEILDGELYTSPRPAGPHAEAASVLTMDLGGAFHRGRGGPGGWIILSEPELHFLRDVLVPDLAGWKRSRLPAVPQAAFIELAPDWVCEVSSPSTARIDRTRKLPIYARERVPYVWLVHPGERLLDVYRLDGDTYRLIVTHGGDDRARLEPFAEVELELGALWPEVAQSG